MNLTFQQEKLHSLQKQSHFPLILGSIDHLNLTMCNKFTWKKMKTSK